MANKIVRIILIIIIFLIFFEVGLFGSYTIMTSEVPDIQGLVDMQVSKITGIFNPEKVNEVLIKDPTPIKISNKKDVGLKMENLSKVDGVNVESMNVTTYDDTDKDKINVTVQALGYASPNSTSGQIIISQNPSYKVIAVGEASLKEKGYMVDTNTLAINSVLKLY